MIGSYFIEFRLIKTKISHSRRNLCPPPAKLAAIIFTGIVEYTALMGKDEQKAFELLDRNDGVKQNINWP
jgi:hypothetical protein